MSDQAIDPRFESLLRGALAAEAASIPLRVGPDQIMERAAVRHGYRVRSRLGLPRLSMAIAAGAAAVVLVVAGAVGLNFFVNQQRIGAPSPNPSPSPTTEPSVGLGIFEPVSGWIVYGTEAGIWGNNPDGPDVKLAAGAGEPLEWSRDGTRLLTMRGNYGDQRLFILNADGSETQVTERSMELRGATISPDGSRVVFVGGTGQVPGGAEGDCCTRWALYAVDADGGPAEMLLESRFGILSNPTFAPDGTQIAYVDGRGDWGHSVWLVDVDGSNAHQILANETTDGAGHARGLAWSPAGDRIALGLEGTTYTFAIDGSGFTRIGLRNKPYWSPDGSQIVSGPWHPGAPAIDEPAPSPETTAPSPETTEPAVSSIARNGREVLRFTGDRSNGMGDLIAVDPETGDSRVLAEGLADIAGASWSADGKWIAYKYTNGILKVVGPDGVPRQLTAAVTGERVLWGWAWSHDGARLSFRDVDGQFVYDAWTGLRTEGDFGLAVSPDGTKSLYGVSGGAIHSVDVRTHEDSLLVQLPGDDLETVDGIEWSPDGSRLAILNDLNPGFHRLFVLNGDGSGIRVVAADTALSGFDWSPDGAKIAFAESSEVELRIWVANADGTTPTLIGSQPNQDVGGDPVWSPDGSRIAFWTEPGEAFVIDADGSGGVAPLDSLAYEDWRGGWYECSTCLFSTRF